MAYFVLKFVPHRPDFPADLSAAESSVMNEHFAYWQKCLQDRIAVVYGPVGDPGGVWGLAVVEVGTLADAHALRDRDPVVVGDLGVTEVYPMLNALVR
ncbi:YciI family protein [Nocardia sp. BMG111209]|uniref:YciI family protein n=1 Tax=Nocardia sp. BMG111209 TaxID=1160137 RepID=UPI00036F7A0A|nr:YciI family protein [Nocardia sp. BMG111209]